MLLCNLVGIGVFRSLSRLLRRFFQCFFRSFQFLARFSLCLVGILLYLGNILSGQFLGGFGKLLGQILWQFALGQFGQILHLLRGFFGILFGSFCGFLLLRIFCFLGGFRSLLGGLG